MGAWNHTDPLSYLVKLSGDQTWKRQIDYLQQMTDSPHEQNKSTESFIKYPQTSGCTEPTATQDTHLTYLDNILDGTVDHQTDWNTNFFKHCVF